MAWSTGDLIRRFTEANDDSDFAAAGAALDDLLAGLDRGEALPERSEFADLVSALAARYRFLAKSFPFSIGE
jgi:hypothetical protein